MRSSSKEETKDNYEKKSDAQNKAKEEHLNSKSKKTDEEDRDKLPEVEEQSCDETDDQSDKSVNDGVRAVDQELTDIKDRYMRILAEYDNFRRRTQKEREGLYSEAVADVTKEWLSVIDNVERAISYAEKSADENAGTLTEGLMMIYKQSCEVLAKLGVEEIPSEAGSAFDPNLHAAVTHIEDDSLGDQCIAQVFLKGYRKGDRVIRHTLVQVAN
jgi:molecular chaperone GrpE